MAAQSLNTSWTELCYETIFERKLVFFLGMNRNNLFQFCREICSFFSRVMQTSKLFEICFLRHTKMVSALSLSLSLSLVFARSLSNVSSPTHSCETLSLGSGVTLGSAATGTWYPCTLAWINTEKKWNEKKNFSFKFFFNWKNTSTKNRFAFIHYKNSVSFRWKKYF
jgi:hypothetical protein